MSTEVAGSPSAASGQLRRVQEALEANPNAIVMVLPDEIHRRRLQKAVEKQIKNATAARGQMSSLDDANDPHLGDVIRTLENCERILINTRPAENQLDGTPIGAALTENGTKDKSEKKGTRGGSPKKVGEVLAEQGDLADEIQWAATVPEPRPRPGTTVITSPTGSEVEIREAIGYDPERNAFRVVDADNWDGFVFYHGATDQWRLLSQALEYGEDPSTEESTEQTSITDAENAAALDSIDNAASGPHGDDAVDLTGSTSEEGEREGLMPEGYDMSADQDGMAELRGEPGSSAYADSASEPDAPKGGTKSAGKGKGGAKKATAKKGGTKRGKSR